MFKRILVATDLSPVSKPAVKTALTLAAREGSEVFVLYVNEKHQPEERWLDTLFDEEREVNRQVLEREEEASRRLLRDLIETVSADVTEKVAVEVQVRHGRAARAIVAAAEEVGADLVVVGSKGRRGTLGSVAEVVVREAGRPVLVVPVVETAG